MVDTLNREKKIVSLNCAQLGRAGNRAPGPLLYRYDWYTSTVKNSM